MLNGDNLPREPTVAELRALSNELQVSHGWNAEIADFAVLQNYDLLREFCDFYEEVFFQSLSLEVAFTKFKKSIDNLRGVYNDYQTNLQEGLQFFRRYWKTGEDG